MTFSLIMYNIVHFHPQTRTVLRRSVLHKVHRQFQASVWRPLKTGLMLLAFRVVIRVKLSSSAYTKELTPLSYRNDFWVAAAVLKEQREMDFIYLIRDFSGSNTMWGDWLNTSEQFCKKQSIQQVTCFQI